jgi:16S rRNA processing protein RimM
MSDSNLILIGKVVAPHALTGEVRVQFYTDNFENFKKLNILDKNGTPIKILSMRAISKDIAIAKLEFITDRNQAESAKGTELFAARDELPKTSASEFYITDLIGMTVVKNNKTIGTVVAMHNFGAGDIMEIAPENGDATIMESFIGVTVHTKEKLIEA